MSQSIQFWGLLLVVAAFGCGEADGADAPTFEAQAQAGRAAGDGNADGADADGADREGEPDVVAECRDAVDGRCAEDRCPDAARVCAAICDGADIAVPEGCPQPACRCPEPVCPDPARICEAACAGRDIDVPRGCPIPGCHCPEEPPAPVVVRLLWGQIPGALPGRDDRPRDRFVDDAAVDRLRGVDARALPAVRPRPHGTVWAGSAQGHGVRVEVLDTVRFEENDRVAGCRADAADRRCNTAEWKTRTTTSHDGIILKFSPQRGHDRRAVVFNLGPFEDVVIAYDKLADLNGLLVADRAGNQISVSAVELGDCGAGFVEGLWLGSAPGQGGFAGVWWGYEGTLGGGMQGVYRPDGLGYGGFTRIDGGLIAFGDGTHGGGEFEMTARNVLGEPIASLWGHYGAGFYHGAFALTCGDADGGADGDVRRRARPELAEPRGERPAR